MQCKDIPTIPILKFIARHKGRWCNWYFKDERDVRQSMPEGFNTPDKLVLAKMRKLINKNLVSGCDCGCRGDYEITEKGLQLINGL